ncbi:integral membrane transferase [Paractinoplanes durhamensis]|uniref:Integral membrane transferase n=2 Tax=Paractinoplanes durhamensis TaxID=113563 RepID=A0ABQ3Z3L9_9ACTN|nr:integral membrane transferase [Actinoplanes durhamensis]
MSVSGRDRYFDFLRALALIRVVLHHSFMSVVALQLAFPAMGVMFALGGSLMARSVDRDAGRAVRNRLRRLLPAVWLMGLILVPLMFYRGWPDRPGWSSLLLWAVPVGLPPASEFGEHLGAGVLWYIYTYVWLVLLSPWLLRLYRLWNLPAVLLPFVCLLLLFGYQGIFSVEVFWVLQNIFTYGTFWVLGIAHREGDLARLRAPVVLGVAVACVAGASAWAWRHPVDGEFAPHALPIAWPVYMFGFVLVLLRWAPPMGWMDRLRPVGGFVSLVNNRAVTIYLWHVAALVVAVHLCEPLGAGSAPAWGAPWPGVSSHWPAALAGLAVMSALLGVAVLAFGWVEDLAARRRPRLSPFVSRRPPAVVPAPSPVST